MRQLRKHYFHMVVCMDHTLPKDMDIPRKHIMHSLLLAGILHLPILLMWDIHQPPIHQLVIQCMELLAWEWEGCYLGVLSQLFLRMRLTILCMRVGATITMALTMDMVVAVAMGVPPAILASPLRANSTNGSKNMIW
nr:uncharacterized protein LOC114825991 isoform X2 [Malus domestica]